eukprot:scaffold16957_cov107-Isochrysis_galbana.AAC.1
MSVPAFVRQNLAWAARPPGPASFWYAVGSAIRQVGRSMDAAGAPARSAWRAAAAAVRHSTRSMRRRVHADGFICFLKVFSACPCPAGAWTHPHTLGIPPVRRRDSARRLCVP